jgi:hypothetical protein
MNLPMNLKPISAGFILALAALHPASASDVLNAGIPAQCAPAVPQRPLSLRNAPTLACPIGPARFSPRTAEADQNFSPAPTCAAAMPMPRLATVIE